MLGDFMEWMGAKVFFMTYDPRTTTGLLGYEESSRPFITQHAFVVGNGMFLVFISSLAQKIFFEGASQIEVYISQYHDPVNTTI